VGTGAAFSLLPAQNATGNWIKVVQRVPVRITLDAKQIEANPLRVGLSMDAEVDVSNKAGKMLADAPRSASLAEVHAYAGPSDAADKDVRRVIAANIGGLSHVAKSGNAGSAVPAAAPAAPAAKARPVAAAI